MNAAASEREADRVEYGACMGDWYYLGSPKRRLGGRCRLIDTLDDFRRDTVAYPASSLNHAPGTAGSQHVGGAIGVGFGFDVASGTATVAPPRN